MVCYIMLRKYLELKTKKNQKQTPNLQDQDIKGLRNIFILKVFVSCPILKENLFNPGYFGIFQAAT